MGEIVSQDVHEGKTPDEIKQEWLGILDGEDPDDFTTPKSLSDGHFRGSAFQYKEGMKAALKGEGPNPAILDHAYHDGWTRMVWGMQERGIEPLPRAAKHVLALPPRHKFR